MVGIVAGEEELGIQKRCPRCGEWLPFDGEFWYYQTAHGRRVVMAYCRACWQERGNARHNHRTRPHAKRNAA